ncbi:AMP-binding protein [Ramlibacter sp. G-1-2-2]|uniref:AMP-binding protein n=1 Tax=Ramlibacter agri TaxID=2728837 RepID=A0A848H0G7_9BURK|nr:AMP-binding protein [Ramlibacter agri]NML42580.1 AMP-binding protein [Ramlibacter agri]
MADWISLARVALPGPAQRAVARRGGALIAHERFSADVARWQAAFAAVPGQHVAIYFADSYDFACALFGAWHAGKVAMLPGDAQPATLERLLPQVAACAGELPGALQPAAAPGAPLHELDLHETQAVIYTSGSSGQPVAIRKRLAQLEAEVQHLETVFGARMDAGGAPLIRATVSHQHIYGLLFVTTWPLAAGRVVEVEKLVYPEQMAQRLGLEATALVSSPAHLKRLPESLDWSAARGQLRAIFSSGGPLPPESSGQAHALLGVSPTEVYGSSETGGVAWRQRAHDGDAWTALPEVQWRLKDDTLCVRSAHLDGDEWWETADRAKALPDGRFVLQGRADRIVKIEEKRVSLVALEDALAASGLVAEGKALLVPSEGGPRLAVVAVPSAEGWSVLQAEGKRGMSARIRQHLLQGFERVVLPRRFRYLRELPVNTQGKATEALLGVLFQPELPRATWRERRAPQAAVSLEIVPQLRVFEGHFPGAPVLPGVVQLDWAIAFGRRAFELPPRFLRAEQMKFQQPVLPPVQLELELEWKAEARQLHFRFASQTGQHSSGRLVFGEA